MGQYQRRISILLDREKFRVPIENTIALSVSVMERGSLFGLNFIFVLHSEFKRLENASVPFPTKVKQNTNLAVASCNAHLFV